MLPKRFVGPITAVLLGLLANICYYILLSIAAALATQPLDLTHNNVCHGVVNFDLDCWQKAEHA